MTIALDTEFVPATADEPIGRLVCVSLANDHGVDLLHADDPQTPARIVAAFAEGVVLTMAPVDVVTIGHRFPFLWPVMLDAYERGDVYDVATREKAIDIAEGEHFRRGVYSLGAIAYRRAGIELDKSGDTWRMHYGELLPWPVAQWPEAARRYALLDAVATWRAFQEQAAWASRVSIDVLGPCIHHARAHLNLYRQTVRGMHTDPAWVERLDERLAAEMETLRAIAFAAGLARYKHKVKRPSPIVRTKKAAQAMMLDLAASDPTVRVTYTKPTDSNPDGQVSLSQEALEEAGFRPGEFVDVPGHGHVLVDAIVWERLQAHLGDAWDPAAAYPLVAQASPVHPLESYRLLGSVQSRRTKVVPVLRHPVVRTRYDECVESARTSSSGFDEDSAWVGTNLQNQERDNRVRGCLVPRPGHVFGISDFSMLELVTLAQVEIDVCGRSALADAINEGIDVHAQFGADMLGIPFEDFDKNHPPHKLARQGGKAWNFGKPGGMGRKRFIAWARKTYKVEVTEAEEREHTHRWHARYPEHEQFFAHVRRFEGPPYKYRNGRRVGTYTIVVPRCGHVRGGMDFPDACNTHFQTLGAFVAKRALWLLLRAEFDPSSPLFGCPQVLFVHDENVTEIPKTVDVAAAVAEQERLMAEAARYFCPDVRQGVESIIAERYKK